ncbi:MAG: hypothetical protein HAW63_04535 [Bdellovibrionaceae bacterium]|nr:hypothetical protein [Pseudobdellovibrionaceae bacterium]
MNNTVAKHIIEQLLFQKVTDFCICAGGRNVPLISVLVRLKEVQKESLNKNLLQINIYEFFDERSASFFALGRSKATKKPTVVITTSGTAVAETLPAMLEAKYSNTPLIILSADRPKSYQNAYTPQTMNQANIFSFLNIKCWNLDENNFKEFVFSSTTKKQYHINASFNDPIVFNNTVTLDSKILAWLTKEGGDSAHRDVEPPPFVSQANILESKNQPCNKDLLAEDRVLLAQFFSKGKRPLVLVSKLDLKHQSNLINFLLKLNTFVYLEAGSGLWGERKLELLLLKAGEKTLEQAFENKWFDSVIKIGNTPTVKVWRLLEDKFKTLPVLSVVEHGESGLSRSKQKFFVEPFLKTFCDDSISSLGITGAWGRDSLWKEKIKTLDKQFYKEKHTRCKENPFSEEALVRQMSEVFLEENNIFLGNSLSIRHWDSVAIKKAFCSVESHRGLNGIDGLVSGFLGWASGMSDKNKSWAVLGDLSALYDLNALWISKQLSNKNWAIIIVNNFGGKIFKPLFNQKILEANHSLEFEHWAKLFNCSYTKIEAKNFTKQFNKNITGIVEVVLP